MTAEKKNTLQIITTIIIAATALCSAIIYTGGKVANFSILLYEVKKVMADYPTYKQENENFKQETRTGFIELRKENIAFRDSVIKHLLTK